MLRLDHLSHGSCPPARFARLDEPRFRQDVVDQFHYLYYHAFEQTWMQTTWLGVRVHKCPLDLWIYQELIRDVGLDVIVETGTYEGGSALYLATLCDLMGRGRVITIDVTPRPGRPEHPRLEYLEGSSTSDAIRDALQQRLQADERVLVILDSDHSEAHVLDELEQFAPLIAPGGYLIVEDTNVNGHPVHHHHGAGPMEAVRAFLADHPEFESDRTREKFFMSFNPRGYLRRIDATVPRPAARRSRRPAPTPPPAAPPVEAPPPGPSPEEEALQRLTVENERLRLELAARDTAAARDEAYARQLEHDLQTIYASRAWRVIAWYRHLRARVG
jgi:cephalosporin hydroxylase